MGRLYKAAKKKIFDQYIDTIFGSAHDSGKIIKEYRQYSIYFKKNYLKYLPENRRAQILEIGCGMGHFQYFLKQQGYLNVTGIDISSQEIAFCREQGFSVKKAEALAYLKKLKESSVDSIIFDDVIYYFSKEEVVSVLSRIFKVLKKNGVCFIKTLNMSNPVTGANSHFRDFATETNFTEESLAQVCKLTGFQKVLIKPLNVYIFYYNPVNYIAMGIAFFLSLVWRLLYLLLGRKTTRIFSKDILAICFK